MPRRRPKVLLAARTVEGRRQQRKGIRLRDFTIQDRTRLRYEVAVGKILPFLEQHMDLQDMDGLVTDWIELEWVRGASVNDIADTLSGLHFFLPEFKGRLRQSWRMFRSWRRVESPQRAPPLTVDIVCAVIALAIEKGDIVFALLFAIGFRCLLRTGELLALQYKDIEFSRKCGVLSLTSSKSGLRTGTEESVAIRDSLVLQLLDTVFSTTRFHRGQRLWPHSGQSFRDSFSSYMRAFRICHLQMKPYSLRRGGATHLLQQGMAMDCILVRGRWRSLSVARLYLQDGMAQIPHLRISPLDRVKIQQYSTQCPITAFTVWRPCMGPWKQELSPYNFVFFCLLCHWAEKGAVSLRPHHAIWWRRMQLRPCQLVFRVDIFLMKFAEASISWRSQATNWNPSGLAR